VSKSFHPQAFKIRHLDSEAPWRWLMAGWRDFVRAPRVSVSYGAVFTVVGYFTGVNVFNYNIYYLLLPLAAGFMLMGPLLGVGLYDISRRHERGEKATLFLALTAWRKNLGQIALMGMALMLFMLAWIRIATLIYALFFVETAHTLDEFVAGTLLSEASLPFLVLGTAVGGILAMGVFSISAISVPMLMDRDIDVLSAILTSVRSVIENWKVMWGWACLIVLFIGAGLATFCIGLMVTMPLIGYASWHAYRDLLPPE